MKLSSILSLVVAGAISLGTVQADIVQTDVGGTASGTTGDIIIIDVLNDENDWIDLYGFFDFEGTLYYGFDYTVDDNTGETGEGGFFSGLQFFQDDTEHLAIGNTWFSLNISTFTFGPGDNDLTSTPYVIGQTFRLVARVDFHENADDDATVWINPTSSASESTTLSGDNTFNNIRMRAGNESGQVTYGNIIYATTFEEALGASVGVAGDANGDGNFDFGDIEAFFLALTDSAAYAAQYPNVSILLLDMNADGNTDFGDIEAFFMGVTGG